jgi:hypothetical protein
MQEISQCASIWCHLIRRSPDCRLRFNAQASAPGTAAVWTWRVARPPALAEALKQSQIPNRCFYRKIKPRLTFLDDGWSCQEVADTLLLNDDTIRNWHKLSNSVGSRA